MDMTGNTILITGGGSGIGRGLAEAFHALGNQVIVAGRRQEALDAVVAANPGMKAMTLDVADAADIAAFAARVVQAHPALNVLVNNAGIMRPEKLTSPAHLADAEALVVTNVLGPIRLTAALLPHLLAQPKAAVLNVSSGLAFMPLAATPTYNATKAAIHSYSQSLRYQLRDSTVQVIELVPPGVATALMPGLEDNPHMMPLAAFVSQTMGLLQSQPEAEEICVEQVHGFRFAERNGQFDTVFEALNQMSF